MDWLQWMIMPYKRYADFSGRSRRREYWMFFLFYMIVWIVLNMVFGAGQMSTSATGVSFGSNLTGVGGLIGAAFALGSFIPALAVAVRRLHDQNRSGWMLLLGLIPILGGIALFVFMLLEGTRGSNTYGPDPKGYGDTAAFS